MERLFAVLGSVGNLFLALIISYYVIMYSYSEGLIPKKIRKLTDSKIVFYLKIINFLISFFIPGLLFKILYNIDDTYHKNHYWRCDLMHFNFVAIMLLTLCFFVYFFFLIVGLYKPIIFKFNSRKNILFAFMLLYVSNIFWFILNIISIYLFSGINFDFSCEIKID